jgi:hypothetical protein
MQSRSGTKTILSLPTIVDRSLTVFPVAVVKVTHSCFGAFCASDVTGRSKLLAANRNIKAFRMRMSNLPSLNTKLLTLSVARDCTPDGDCLFHNF